MIALKAHTLKELISIFNEHGIEFYIKKQKDNIIKVHFMVENENES